MDCLANEISDSKQNLRIAVPYTRRRLASYPQDVFQSLKKSENALQIEINAEMHWQMKKTPPKLENSSSLHSAPREIWSSPQFFSVF